MHRDARLRLAYEAPASIRGTAKARMEAGFCVCETAMLQAVERGTGKESMFADSESRERNTGATRVAPRI